MPIKTLSQFVASDVCLSCDGCCRFKEPGTIWRPKMSTEETARARSAGLAEKILDAEILDQDQFIKTRPGCGEHLCQFFNPVNHACGIYQARPFECALYPFVISKDAQGVGLYVHLHCPYVQTHLNQEIFNTYKAYLKEYFSDAAVTRFLKRNVLMLNDYSAYQNELEFVFRLEGL